jgi:hypothetical protein
MRGTKILGTVLAVAVILSVMTPMASAQTEAGILHNQWFRVKASMKGYMLDGETVLSKSSGGATDYIKFTYNAGTYSLLTCAQDDQEPGIWHKITPIDPFDAGFPTPRNEIAIANIYGDVYPQIWDFGGTPIVFYDGYSTYSLYSILYMKITGVGSALTKASISTLSCGIWADIEDLGESFNGIGSCGLSGSLIPEAQVATKVPEQCRQ